MHNVPFLLESPTYNELPWAILGQKNDRTGFHTEERGGGGGGGTGIPPPQKFDYDVVIELDSTIGYTTQ